MKSKFWQLLKTTLKFLITGVALFWVFSKISFNDVFLLIKTANYFDLFLAMLLFALSKIIATVRLNLFFSESNIELNFKENIKLYSLGMFYNLFLPGGIGGDGYKIYLINKFRKTGVKPLFNAVLVDRLVGVLALGILVTVLIPYASKFIAYQEFVLILSIVLYFAFYFFLKLFFKNFLNVYSLSLLYSLGVQALQLLCAYFIIKGLGYNLIIVNYLVLFLISSIVAILPFTIGGVGAREFTFLIGSSYLSLEADIAIALSLLFYLITAFISFIGVYWVIKPIQLETK